jgi:hypothetical protein
VTKSILILFIHLAFVCLAFAQGGVLKGTVRDALNNNAISFANVFLLNTTNGTTTDIDGNFILENIKPGVYDVEISYLGYKTQTFFEAEIQSAKPFIINVKLEEDATQLSEVVVKAEPFRKTSESPLSLRTIGITEIKRNPGGNRDISRVIQSLPGVTSTVGFRNDLIIRGGSPNENRFFIDDVEIPTINHFATQGSSGGPAGIINVDFIREVDFYSGAFPASRYNSLSSVFNFKFKDGRDDRIGATATVGAQDIGISLDGPVGKKGTFLISARRSYLQFLFKAIGLPFLPVYNDFQVKYKHKFNAKNEITFLGIGAVDNFKLNLEADDDETKQFILGNLPVNNQWNYTNGLVYKHYNDNGFTTFVLSRSMLNNDAYKFLNNDESRPENKILDYLSQEIENKMRLENTSKVNEWTISAGVNYEFAKYNTSTFNKIFSNGSLIDINYSSKLSLQKYGAFTSLNRTFIGNRLNLSAGLRLDGNSYSDDTRNPLEQLSPRFSLAYSITPKLAFNFNSGIYYQLPPYTVLGYNEGGQFVNRNNNISYIRNKQLVAGFEYNTSFSSKISIESYFKDYDNYPFLLREQISLANLGGDFGVIGNEPAQSTGQGRAYGLEMLFQQRLYKGYYGITSVTIGRSEFTNGAGEYIPSSWDARYIANLTIGKRFKRNWELGVKWRFQSGLPTTPTDANSSLVQSWDRNLRAIPDFSRINTTRTADFGFIDARLDKKWFFKSWDINLYLDIQNITSSSVPGTQLILDRPLDENGRPIGAGIITNPTAPIDQQRYKLKSIDNATGQLLPVIGLVISI